MGVACCRCYNEPITSDTKVDAKMERQLQQSKPPMHAMQSRQSVPSTSAQPSSLTNGKRRGDKSIENIDVDVNDPTRLKLIEFYKVHSPKRLLETQRFEEILRRYHGRESKLFSDLARKYKLDEAKKERIQGTPSSNEDIKKESIVSDSSDDDGINDHPMLSNSNKSESTPINEIRINSKTVNISEKHADIFKIEITKPNKSRKKKKAIGTNLFGSQKFGKKDYAEKPKFVGSLSMGNRAGVGTGVLPGLGEPKAITSLPRSNTLTLDVKHKANLDKRRQSSLAVRRNQKQRNLPIEVNKVWSIFAKYIIDSMMEEKEEKKKEKEEEEENQVDILDQIINSEKNDKNNKNNKNDKFEFEEDLGRDVGDDDESAIKKREQHKSLEVLAIDPRLFEDASSRSSLSSASTSSSVASSSSDVIDVYSISLSYSQFNIVLNNAAIQISPDMSAALIWCLLSLNGLIPDSAMHLGQSSDNLHNDPMRERGFHGKQFKLIYKCRIKYGMVECLMRKLASSSLVSSQDRSLHPRHLSYISRNYVIWDKMFQHLRNGTSFNVEEDYLYGTLSEEELADSDSICQMLSSLSTHWQHRVQLMEHIDDKLNAGSQMQRDIFFASILSENDNFITILRGWSIQLTDDRSGVARSAVTALPTVIQGLLLCIEYPLIIFDDSADIIEPIYGGIFSLVKNRRLKDMQYDAYDAMMSLTDIFAEITNINSISQHEQYQYLNKIVSILENHSDPKCEKHDKARESCVAASAFLLYGINQDPNQDNSIDPLASSPKSATKLSKIMQRKYLLNNDAFIVSIGNILKNGVSDKSESSRKKTFHLIQKLENDEMCKEYDLFNKWDYTVHKKYSNWCKLNERRDRTQSRTKSKKNRARARSKNKLKKRKEKKIGASPSPSPEPSPSPAPEPAP